MDIRYFGWSGITLQHDRTLIGFDLFGDAVSWDALDPAATTILCVTHGHPEHCGSLRSLLSSPAARSRLAATQVVSSEAVIDYLAAAIDRPFDRTHRLQANEGVSIHGAHITTFEWKHTPLLPPGARAKTSFIAHVFSHPIDLMRIGFSSLRLPLNAPMLGFHVRFADGLAVLNYSEGLHRLTAPTEVASIAQRYPADVILFAVEPDDVQVIPNWIKVLQPKTVVIYEAHRPWRERFHLPYVDLLDYGQILSTRFSHMRFLPLIRHEVIHLN